MIARCVPVFAFLLGLWVLPASACYEAQVAAVPAHHVAVEIAVPAVAGNIAAIGGDQRCECPVIEQGAQAVVSESSKDLIVSYEEGADASPNSFNAVSLALAEYSRASSFIARRSEQPPYLFNPRLRQ